MISGDADRQKMDELLTRGVAEVIDREELAAALASGRQLRVKLGVDPTSPNLHLGRSVPLLKLRDFQALGHQVVLIVGDFTGVIGDTSDKESERPMLAREKVMEHAKTYLDQVGMLLDLSYTEVHYNSEWLAKLGYAEIGEQADRFSVAGFIARENIKKRLDAGKRVSLREVLYPLMQGYDSVAVHADVEVGGVDQRFNLLAGRVLQEHYDQRPQDIMMTTFPIEGTDGRKMSSSWGNTINFTDAQDDMYGKVMSMRDELIVPYFVSCTRVPSEEVKEIGSAMERGTLPPYEAKQRLAREIVMLYHGAEKAREAEEYFVKTFRQREMPADAPEVLVAPGTALVEALVRSALVDSKTEARRLIHEGAVVLVADDGEQAFTDPQMAVDQDYDVRIGKKRFLKMRVR